MHLFFGQILGLLGQLPRTVIVAEGSFKLNKRKRPPRLNAAVLFAFPMLCVFASVRSDSLDGRWRIRGCISFGVSSGMSDVLLLRPFASTGICNKFFARVSFMMDFSIFLTVELICVRSQSLLSDRRGSCDKLRFMFLSHVMRRQQNDVVSCL